MTVGTSHYNLSQSCSPDFVWAHVTAYSNIYTCGLDQTWTGSLMLWFIAPNTSSVCWDTYKSCSSRVMYFQNDMRWSAVKYCIIIIYIYIYILCKLHSALLWSWAELESFPGWPSVNAVSRAQPKLGMDIFAWCKWPLFWIRKLLFDSKRTLATTLQESSTVSALFWLSWPLWLCL